jgi:hypothetical protein
VLLAELLLLEVLALLEVLDLVVVVLFDHIATLFEYNNCLASNLFVLSFESIM